MRFLLLFSVFVIATCGLVYELVAGTLASYLLGDTVTQFSTVIGAYLFSMGIGSWLSRFIKKHLITVFIRIELIIGLVGGFSAAFLFVAFEVAGAFQLLLYGVVGITGILVGLEIPLLMRILKDQYAFEDLVSRIFTFDYIGALAASILFPILFMPYLGLVRTALMFGIFNVAVAIWTLYIFRSEVVWIKGLWLSAALVLGLLVAGFIYGDKILKLSEAAAYPGSVIYAKSSPYQRIVLSRNKDDLRLYLNGNLQFSSRDEYRYHEALVHPGLQTLREPKRVLIMGGGDGLALREILKYPSIDSITMVDLDPEVTRLFSTHKDLVQLNQNAFQNPKVIVHNVDAFRWIREEASTYDFICIDFPDPTNFSLGKLYSDTFFRELNRILAPEGLVVIQSTSPFVAKKSFWCVNQTLQQTGLKTVPYHAYVPSFGDWGFIIASRHPYTPPDSLIPGLKFLEPETMERMMLFPKDMAWVETDVNRLNNQILVHYFQEEWAKYE